MNSAFYCSQSPYLLVQNHPPIPYDVSAPKMAIVCNPDWLRATWSFYRYVPSVAAAVIFCLLFLVATGLHLFQMFKTKTWFLTAMVFGCLCMCSLTKPKERKDPPRTMVITYSPVSRIHWLRRSSCFREPRAGLLETDAIHHPEHVYLVGPSAVCGLYIHDSRKNHTVDRWRNTFYHQAALAYENLRHR